MAEKETLAQTPVAPKKHGVQNLDTASTISFVAASTLGAIGVANNVRNNFWHNFIQGFREINTPFAPLRDKFTAQFQKTARDFSAGALGSREYRDTMRSISNNYRNEVADKLLKDFDIPTHGIAGWTIGTVKRVKELGINGRIQSVVGFATVGAITLGSVNVLRNSKNTIDRVEDKIDAGGHSR
ncbi:MAG: hypothetical protein V4735_03370 [Pseudomonadota bacterium]